MLTCRRPSSSARVWASARETRASLPGWFLAAPRLAAPWRVSSISWPGGPGQPLLPGQEAQPLLGLGPLRGVETPWRPEPELRLPGAGAACARAALAAAPTQGARARRARLGSPVRPWPSGGSQTALPERSPIPADRPGRQGPGNVPGEGETAARGGARSPPPPAGFVLPPRAAAGTGPPDFPAAGVGRICGVSDPLASADPSWLHPWRGPQAPLAGTTQLPPCPQALLFKEF